RPAPGGTPLPPASGPPSAARRRCRARRMPAGSRRSKQAGGRGAARRPPMASWTDSLANEGRWLGAWLVPVTVAAGRGAFKKPPGGLVFPSRKRKRRLSTAPSLTLPARKDGGAAHDQRRIFPMRSRSILCLLALGLGPALPAAAQQPPRPNIVILLTDDQRADCLGCQKHPLLKTPNIDALAA